MYQASKEDIICKLAEQFAEVRELSISELFHIFSSIAEDDGNYKVHHDDSREELNNMADMRHKEVPYSMKDKDYFHDVFWNWNCFVNPKSGDVTVTMVETKRESEGHNNDVTFVFPVFDRRTVLELILIKYPITGMYHQPTREAVLKHHIDQVTERLHKDLDARSGNNTMRKSIVSVFAEGSSAPAFKNEFVNEFVQMAEEYCLLHVFKKIRYDDYYGGANPDRLNLDELIHHSNDEAYVAKFIKRFLGYSDFYTERAIREIYRKEETSAS